MIIVSVEEKFFAKIKRADAEILSDFWLMHGPLPQCSRPPVKVGLIATEIGFHVCLQRLSKNQLCLFFLGAQRFSVAYKLGLWSVHENRFFMRWKENKGDDEDDDPKALLLLARVLHAANEATLLVDKLAAQHFDVDIAYEQLRSAPNPESSMPSLARLDVLLSESSCKPPSLRGASVVRPLHVREQCCVYEISVGGERMAWKFAGEKRVESERRNLTLLKDVLNDVNVARLASVNDNAHAATIARLSAFRHAQGTQDARSSLLLQPVGRVLVDECLCSRTHREHVANVVKRDIGKALSVLNQADVSGALGQFRHNNGDAMLCDLLRSWGMNDEEAKTTTEQLSNDDTLQNAVRVSHCDVHPCNIILVGEGDNLKAYLADFESITVQLRKCVSPTRRNYGTDEHGTASKSSDEAALGQVLTQIRSNSCRHPMSNISKSASSSSQSSTVRIDSQ